MAFSSLESLLIRRNFLATAAAFAVVGLGCSGNNKSKHPEPRGKVLVQGVGKLKRRVKKNVADKARRKQALALLEEMETHVTRVAKLIDESRDARARLPVAEQTHENLLAVINEFDQKIRESLLDASKQAVNLREVLTEQEWTEVFPKLDEGAQTA